MMTNVDIKQNSRKQSQNMSYAAQNNSRQKHVISVSKCRLPDISSVLSCNSTVNGKIWRLKWLRKASFNVFIRRLLMGITFASKPTGLESTAELRRCRRQLAAVYVSCLQCRCWWSWDQRSDRRRLPAVHSRVSDAPDLHPTPVTGDRCTSFKPVLVTPVLINLHYSQQLPIEHHHHSYCHVNSVNNACNSLPQSLRDIIYVATFKRHLKTQLLLMFLLNFMYYLYKLYSAGSWLFVIGIL